MTPDEQKQAAAQAALTYVKPGMKIGLGTGSTANYFIDALGELVKGGLNVSCVPTSGATHKRAKDLNIPLTTLDKEPFLDLTVDGADEIDDKFNLIKGGGGALLLEKIVASSSRHMIVIADASKKVKTLGKFPLPVEVVPFGIRATAWKLERAFKIVGAKGKLTVRMNKDKPFITDSGHGIIDCALDHIPDAPRLAGIISTIPGVVDHGLFIGLAGIVLIGTDKGVKTLKKPA